MTGINAMAQQLVWALIVSSCIISGCSATTFNVVNGCSYTVWPASWSTASGGGGSTLAPGGQWTLTVGAGWSGRVWGRTGCSASGNNCQTGDCGGLVCTGSGQPATLFEATVDGGNNLDYYDISIIDAFNLPMSVTPSTSTCTSLSCQNADCPQPPIYRVPECSGCTQGCAYGTSYTIRFC